MKSKALLLLKIAAELFPPLAAIIGEALSKVAQDHPDRQLVDEVREILDKNPIHDAVKTLEERG